MENNYSCLLMFGSIYQAVPEENLFLRISQLEMPIAAMLVVNWHKMRKICRAPPILRNKSLGLVLSEEKLTRGSVGSACVAHISFSFGET